MKNGNSVEPGLVVILIILLLVVAIEFVMIWKYTTGLTPMREAVTACERELPRNQTCRLVYSAQPVDTAK